MGANRIVIWTLAWGLAIWLALQGGEGVNLFSWGVLAPLLVLAVMGWTQGR